MTVRRHALLMFCKPPIPGEVKTRLTLERGGIFTPEDAAEFFKRSLFDVSEMCFEAIWELEAASETIRQSDPSAPEHVYDFFVCTTPAENLELMRQTFESLGQWPREIHYLTDEGANFDEHFDDAFKQIFALGYDDLVSVGGDVPTMPRSHVVSAFQWLDYYDATFENGGMVQAPCQECGVSLVGWTAKTPMDHQGVYYSPVGRPALDAYVEKCAENNVVMASLDPAADVDDAQDLAHTISLLRALAFSKQSQPDIFVAQRTLDWLNWKGLRVGTPPNEDRDSREGIDT